MKITFPNKEQAKEAFENAKRFSVKYTWKMRAKGNDKNEGKGRCLKQ